MNNHNIEKEVKLNLLKKGIIDGELACQWKPSYDGKSGRSITNRQAVQEYICGKLNIHDCHTVNGWVKLLVGLKILEHNPDSQKTKTGLIKPSNDTRYYIHFEKCTHPHISNYQSGATRPPSGNQGQSSSLNQTL